MKFDKSTYFVFALVLVVMTLSVTVFRAENPRPVERTVSASKVQKYVYKHDRYPVVDAEESLPTDSAKLAKLKKRQKRYNEFVFANPAADTGGVTIFPERNFDFPTLPIKESEVIVVGQVLDAQAHRSENQRSVFGDYEIRVDEVLKGSGMTAGTAITVERVGGFVKYPNGRKVLFNLMGHGAPSVGARYVFFLNIVDDDYSIVTGYELSASGVVPLDHSKQFYDYAGQNEPTFLETLRDAISKSGAQ